MKIWVTFTKVKEDKKWNVLGAFPSLKRARRIVDFDSHWGRDMDYRFQKFQSMGGKKK